MGITVFAEDAIDHSHNLSVPLPESGEIASLKVPFTYSANKSGQQRQISTLVCNHDRTHLMFELTDGHVVT